MSSQIKPVERTICLCHDIEGGLGHLNEDPQFAEQAVRSAATSLEQMLLIEDEFDIKATYFVVAMILKQTGERIRSDGHSLGFHSYDHRVETRNHAKSFMTRFIPARDDPVDRQLQRCRDTDALILGYRPPQSILTHQLSARNLCSLGFEWLASSKESLRINTPAYKGGLAWIPIHFDDYSLYTGMQDYASWEKFALTTVRDNEFTVFSLHDCYGPYWLPSYHGFLQKLMLLGNFSVCSTLLT